MKLYLRSSGAHSEAEEVQEIFENTSSSPKSNASFEPNFQSPTNISSIHKSESITQQERTEVRKRGIFL